MRGMSRAARLALVSLLIVAPAAAADWPPATEPLFTAKPLTAPDRFTRNAEGPEFTRDGRLFVVNCERDGTVCEVFPDGRVEVLVTLPAGSTANAIRETSSGALLLADFTGHNVLRVDPRTREVTVHAHEPRFNQPNDLAIRRDDVAFASDPKWADGTGQIWRVDRDGTVTLAAGAMGTTNGLALSPDERVLYVAESVQRRIWAFDVGVRGELSGKRPFAEFADHGLDGIKCDASGRLFVTRHGKGTVAILRPDGTVEREVEVGGQLVSNVVFGGPDGRIVFATLQDRRAVAQFFSDVAGARWASRPLDRAALAARVKEEFLHAWRGYERYARGHDELKPLSMAPHDWHAASLHMTPVDALDTMLVMGLTAEAEKTRAWIGERLSFDHDISVKVFEITIRILGGLLSAHQMTGDARLLALADDLGARLLPAFESPTGMPYMFVNLRSGQASGAKSNPAEIGTLLLEFGTLAKLTGKPVYYDKAKRALTALYERRDRATGLVGEEIDVETGQWANYESHVGGAIDSYFEYLLKCERLFGDAECGAMWRESRRAIDAHLADEVDGALWFGVADMRTGRRTATTFGALHAFLPSVLALGGDIGRAARLQDSAFGMWRLHGLEPEVFDYRANRVVSPGYQLRPEIVESAYYLAHFTGDDRYVEMGRDILDDLVRHCRTESGFTVIRDVVTKQQGDKMPSYFLAETLKYLYLLFAPDALKLDEVVFNTEAHPLRRTW